jgi:tryptophan halogenase
MHICIVGAGAAGWMTYHCLKNHALVEKITLIKSPSIPKIGVGESTTLLMNHFINVLKLTEQERNQFIYDIGGALKYGVSYEGWSSRKFLHHFTTQMTSTSDNRREAHNIGFTLGAKPTSENHGDYTSPFAQYAYQNKVCIDRNMHRNAYHFDANKFIDTLESMSIGESKLELVIGTVADLIREGELVKEAVLTDQRRIEADFFISCVGQRSFNEDVFGETYVDYGEYLLTRKAWACPVEYSDPVAQFHPYTISKTMSSGWRWITPTRERIGTGYVFSDAHISVEQARDEFLADVGDTNLEPFLVDFSPRRTTQVFRPNTCTFGMASGFQEPLDAPGLSMSYANIYQLYNSLHLFENNRLPESVLEKENEWAKSYFDFWASFIIHQYKTCMRDDTQFWQDHKQVSFPTHNEIVHALFNPTLIQDGDHHIVHFDNPRIYEPWMFYNTTSGKDLTWIVPENLTPFKHHYEIDPSLLSDHRAFIESLNTRETA